MAASIFTDPPSSCAEALLIVNVEHLLFAQQGLNGMISNIRYRYCFIVDKRLLDYVELLYLLRDLEKLIQEMLLRVPSVYCSGF